MHAYILRSKDIAEQHHPGTRANICSESLLFLLVRLGMRFPIPNKKYFDEGVGRIHFFPQGLADASALHITSDDGALSWTVIVNPLTGNAQLVDGLYDANQLNRN